MSVDLLAKRTCSAKMNLNVCRFMWVIILHTPEFEPIKLLLMVIVMVVLISHCDSTLHNLALEPHDLPMW